MTALSVRKCWPAFLILLAGAIVYAKLSYRHDIGFFDDDAVYILAARSLLSGHYSDLTLPHQPPEIHFLPGLPMLLAPCTIFAQSHWNRLKLVPYLLAVLSGFLAWILYRQWLPEKISYAALALFVLNPVTLFLSDVLLSEWWLLCLSLAAILLIGDLEERGSGIMRKIALTWMLTWAALTRPEGILLTVGLTGALWLRPASWRTFRWVGLAPPLAFFGWLLRNFLLSGHISTYVHFWQPPGFWHIAQTLAALPRMVLGIAPVNIGCSILLLLGGFVLVAGLSGPDRSPAPLWHVVVLFYLLLFVAVRLFWPILDDRFFLPVVPFLSAFVLQGCLFLNGWRSYRIGSWLLGALLMNLAFQNRAAAGAWKPGPYDRLPRHTLAFIRDHVPPRATLLTDKGGIMKLYADHFSGGDTDVSTPEQFAYELLKAETPYIWIRRQPLADRRLQQQWIRADRWMRDWPQAFFVIFYDPAEASTIYALTMKPSFVEAYETYMGARQALQRGDGAAAGKKFATALRLYPEFPGALNDYAAILLESGNVQASEAYLQTAIRLRPNFGLARLNLARVYERQNKIELAKQSLGLASEAASYFDDSTLRDWIHEEEQRLKTIRRI